MSDDPAIPRCARGDPADKLAARFSSEGSQPLTVSRADKAKSSAPCTRRRVHSSFPNPWDGGSARVLAGLGFEALATSSGAKAGVLGKRDGKVTREEALANAKQIVEACDLPVAADLEKGFGDGPEAAAETIRQAAGIGLVGGSIEDATGDKDKPLYDVEAAGGTRRSCGEGGAGAAVSLRADGTRRRVPARPRRSRRCHQAPEGLRGAPAPTCCSRPACRTSRR